MKIKILLLVLFLTGTSFATLNHETRAVWVATNFGLDFPHGVRDAESQKIVLRRIFKDIKEKNYNTVYFQVRSNGTVLFDSPYEPWSGELTGVTGKKPDYDPAQLAISLAREFGLEIHAWVNTFRCFSGNDREPLMDGRHPVNTKAGIIEKYSEGNSISYWMNPGEPESRDYLVNLFSGLMENYNFDGIQLDFVRYPGKNFNDSQTYSTFGNKRPLAEWRRNNITGFIKVLREKLQTQNPYVKIGATPIGIYKNPPGVFGLEAYNDVYQDVESWINLSLVDYIIPQIYWDVDSNPKFDVIASEWMKLKSESQIIIGIGAYKEEIARELNRQIGICRQLGADGVAFFRYRNISGEYLFDDITLPAVYKRFNLAALPLPTALRASSDPLMNNSLKISWDYDKANERGLKYFVLYDMSGEQPSLVKLVEPDERSAYVTSGRKIKKTGYFTVGNVDINWNENYSTKNVIRVENKGLENLLANINPGTNPLLQKSGKDYKLSLYSTGNETLEISLNTQGEIIQKKRINLDSGMNILTISGEGNPDVIKLDFIERNETRSLKL